MRQMIFGAMGLLTAGIYPALAEVSPSIPQTAPAQTTPPAPPAVVPDRRADTSLPQSGVIQPVPDATRDATVRPPNVDPGMTVAPPGTPGGNPTVNPK